MNRLELVAKLERLAPALSGNDLIPILTHFWFTGKDVIAYNDQIGVSAPCKVPFEGAVPGMMLLNLLKASKAKDLEFEYGEGDKELIVRAGSSKYKLALRPPSAFDGYFTMPKPDKTHLAADTVKFQAAINCCMRSVSIDTTVPDQLGITVLPTSKSLLFYSTDNATLSHARIPFKDADAMPDRAILSAHFCRQLLNLAPSKGEIHLEIKDDAALFVGVGGTLLFGKLIDSPKPLDFNDSLSRHYPKGSEKGLQAIPTKLELILERACIVAAANMERVHTVVSVKGDAVKFHTASKFTEVSDTMNFIGKGDPVELLVNPKLLKNGLADFDMMQVRENCFVMATDETLYIVAADGK